VRDGFAVILLGILSVAAVLLGVTRARDQAPDAPIDTRATVLAVERADGVEITSLEYRSGGLRVRALACRKPSGERLPILLYEHGGLDGITGREFCLQAADSGFVVAMSAYRGQSGSEGAPEICLGEVDDALTLLAVTSAHFGGDAKRVVHAGVSLGGCVALKAAARDPHARAVAVFAPTTDLRERLNLLRAQGREAAASRWEGLLGSAPERFEERNPVAAAARVAAPLLLVHGGNDPQTPLAASCRVRDARQAAGRRVTNTLLDKSGQAWNGAPMTKQPCQGPADARGLPGSWGDGDHFVVLRDLEHQTTPHVRGLMISFLKAHVTPSAR
jgi:dipeptidyl aminopeptidase/acylaminoacyl peptidase